MAQRTLYMAVLNEWVMDSLRCLGSGSMYHLSYHPSLIEPTLLASIRDSLIPVGHPVQVILTSGGSARRVAEAELTCIVDFRDYVRFEFRILSVVPFLRDGAKKNTEGYLCWLPEED